MTSTRNGGPDRDASRRERVLTFVRAFCVGHNYGPSVRQVMAGVGLASTSAANHHIQKLKAGGRLIGGEEPHTLRPGPGLRTAPHECPTCCRPFESAPAELAEEVLA